MDQASEKWQGMVTIFSNYWKQFQQEVMQSGVFDSITQGLDFVLDEIKKLKEDGDLSYWAETMGNSITEAIITIVSNVGYAIQAFEGFLAALDGMVIAGEARIFSEDGTLLGFEHVLFQCDHAIATTKQE